MAAQNPGLFITIEGPEGGGKSTNIAFIQTMLQQAGIEFDTTREPGGTAFGESLRQVLLSNETGDLSGDTELLLMFAARLEHVRQRIRPTLEQGTWVLCDRFTDSSYAYQGGGRGLSLDRIAQLETWCLGDFKPDVTLLLDVPVETSLQRINSRGQLDRFEDQERDFFDGVRATYLEMARRDTNRYRVIDASRPLDEVQAELGKLVQDIITKWQTA